MRTLLLLFGAALLLAGCGATGSTVRDEGPAAIGDKAIVSPAAAAGEDTTAAVPATPSPGAAFVYFLRYDQPEPTRRSIPTDMTVPEGSLRALLEGPSLAEDVLHYSSAIPEGSRLLGFSVLNRTAIVDLSKLPAISADAQSDALLALYQVVYTVTASGAIEAVQVRQDGRPYGLNSVAGASSALEPPLTRADLSFVIDATTVPGSSGCAVAKEGSAPFVGTPAVTISRPTAGDRITSAIQVRGVVQSKGGPVVIRLLQNQIEVANRIIDEPCRGSFAATIPVPRTLTGPVDLVVIAPGVEGQPAAQAQQQIVIVG
ncbi:MAG: GerMN domain-containing protein [Gaiellales bacterium]